MTSTENLLVANKGKREILHVSSIHLIFTYLYF